MSDSNQDLTRTLRRWRHEPPSAPRFNAEVWAHIEAQRDWTSTIAAFLGRHLGLSARHARWALPVGASLVLALAAAAGAGVGSLRTSHTVNERMAELYVRSIDPLQMPMNLRSP